MDATQVIQMIRAAVCGSMDGARVSLERSEKEDMDSQVTYESGKVRAFEEVFEIIQRVQSMTEREAKPRCSKCGEEVVKAREDGLCIECI